MGGATIAFVWTAGGSMKGVKIISSTKTNSLDPCNKAAADKLAKANFVIREKAYLIRAMQLELERQNPDDNRFM